MHFCTNCHNMYYLKIRDTEEGGNTLIYYCRNCGHEDTTLSSESVCVSETQLRRSEQKYTHMVNEYTKFDPTLPRINTIKCPNQECSSNTMQVGGGKKGATGATGATAKEKKSLKIKSKTLNSKETLEEQDQAKQDQAKHRQSGLICFATLFSKVLLKVLRHFSQKCC